MTEAEWLGCGKPVLMVRALGEEASARKLQLFAVVVLQGPDGLYPEPETHLVMAERFADGLIGAADLRRSWGSGAEVPAVPERAHEWAEWAAIGDTEEYGPRWAFDMMARFVREVFGNPFRPVAFATDWRTDTALALARQMYEETGADGKRAHTVEQIAAEFGVTRPTIYRYLAKDQSAAP